MKDFDFSFNPEEIRRKKKYNETTANLFYTDEIQTKLKNLTEGNKKKKNLIFDKQNWTLKNMTYYGLNVPPRWKVNDKYNKTLMKVLKKDKQFVEFLMNNDNSSPRSNATQSTSNESFFSDIVQYNKSKSKIAKTINKEVKIPPISINIDKIDEEISQSPTTKNKTVSFRDTNFRSSKKIDEYGLITSNNFNASLMNTTNQTLSNNTTNNNFLRSLKTKVKFLDPLNTEINFNKTASNNMLKNAEKHISSITGIKDASMVINEKRILFNSTLNSFNKKSHSTLQNFFKRNIKNESNIKIGNLLNVDYSGLFKKKVNIKNQELKSKWEAIDHYGPNFAHCNTCFNKNLEFFDKINPKEGITIVNYIKSIKDFDN